MATAREDFNQEDDENCELKFQHNSIVDENCEEKSNLLGGLS